MSDETLRSWPLVRIVEAPDPAAAVRYEFNDRSATAPRWVDAADFTLGSPTLNADPDASGVTYGWRTLNVTQKVQGTKENALAVLSSLSREQLRVSGWLMVQLDSVTRPVWFRIYRTAPEPLSLERVYVDTSSGDPADLGDTWQVKVPFIADAFARGERITHAPVTVTQAPTGQAAMAFALPAIQGDAPTPLRVDVKFTTSGTAASDAEVLVGCVTGGSPAIVLASIGESDGLTAGAGTGAHVSNALYFGGSYRPINFTGLPTLNPRLSGYLPQVTPGRYKVALRCDLFGSTSDDVAFLFQFGTAVDVNRGPIYGPPVSVTVDEGFSTTLVRRLWVDLGTFQLPAGMALPRSLAGDLLPPVLPPAFALRVNSGAEIIKSSEDRSVSAARLDAIALIPIDTLNVTDATMLRVRYPEFTPQGEVAGSYVAATFDGETSTDWLTLHLVDGDSILEGLYPGVSVPQGGYPVADPAAENLLTMIALDHGRRTADDPADATITSLGAQSEVTVSYRPYWLNLPGAKP